MIPSGMVRSGWAKFRQAAMGFFTAYFNEEDA